MPHMLLEVYFGPRNVATWRARPEGQPKRPHAVAGDVRAEAEGIHHLPRSCRHRPLCGHDRGDVHSRWRGGGDSQVGCEAGQVEAPATLAFGLVGFGPPPAAAAGICTSAISVNCCARGTRRGATRRWLGEGGRRGAASGKALQRVSCLPVSRHVDRRGHLDVTGRLAS